MNGCLQVSGHSKGQADYQGARRRCLEDEVAKSRGIPGRQERLTEGAVLYKHAFLPPAFLIQLLTKVN